MKQLEATAKGLITQNKNKEGNKIKAILIEAKIPADIIEKTMAEAGIVIESKEKK